MLATVINALALQDALEMQSHFQSASFRICFSGAVVNSLPSTLPQRSLRSQYG